MVIGLAGAGVLTRALETLLFAVEPTDPMTFVSVSVLLIFVAMIGSYIPARRATRTDPSVSLRSE
jgi:putative ABC transport system permease protein